MNAKESKREKMRRSVHWAAHNEITEHFIYKEIARRTKNAHNKKILKQIADDEMRHYKRWTKILGEQVEPSKFKIWFYTNLARFLGLSFSLKLMEKGEGLSQALYQEISSAYPEAIPIIKDEQEHEEELLKMINERFLQYVSSFILGLNDALVELTGALAGLTLALKDTELIAVVGLITGIAASFSMAASEYLSTQEEEDNETSPFMASITTGIAYIITVAILISPYLIASNAFVALACTLALAVLIIFTFTLYTSIAKGFSFKKRFLQMTSISLGVAALSFCVGYGIKKYFGVE